jgi:hypothetical protein
VAERGIARGVRRRVRLGVEPGILAKADEDGRLPAARLIGARKAECAAPMLVVRGFQRNIGKVGRTVLELRIEIAELDQFKKTFFMILILLKNSTMTKNLFMLAEPALRLPI